MLTTRTHFGRGSHGITVIEVLTSIVVAMIGVFGVMILIPFAVQQAQLGLDRDEASAIGRNAFAQYEIEGFRFVDDFGNTRWRAAAGQVVLDRSDTPNAAQIYAIDPLGVTEAGALQTPPQPELLGVFPAVDPVPVDPVVQFEQVNLLDLNGNPYTLAMARKMFRTRDDLVFGEPLDELGPPQQYFDTDGTGTNLRRQARGQMSWNAIAIPVKDNYTTAAPRTWGWKFQLHVLVHKDRDFDTSPTTGARYECRPVIAPPVGTGISYGGGTVTLAPILTDVRKDDWVMMANRDLNGEPGFDTQVGFYRVIGVAYIDDAPTPGYEKTILTLDGPDFQFGMATTHTQTYLVHLVGLDDQGNRRGHVVNVYQRTMRWERKSNWN